APKGKRSEGPAPLNKSSPPSDLAVARRGSRSREIPTLAVGDLMGAGPARRGAGAMLAAPVAGADNEHVALKQFVERGRLVIQTQHKEHGKEMRARASAFMRDLAKECATGDLSKDRAKQEKRAQQTENPPDCTSK
ncbi:unnamed protein product, partial [Prorocentrum cordatum]